LSVGESQDRVTSFFNELLSIVVVFFFECVNGSVYLDDETAFCAVEIHNE